MKCFFSEPDPGDALWLCYQFSIKRGTGNIAPSGMRLHWTQNWNIYTIYSRDPGYILVLLHTNSPIKTVLSNVDKNINFQNITCNFLEKTFTCSLHIQTNVSRDSRLQIQKRNTKWYRGRTFLRTFFSVAKICI